MLQLCTSGLVCPVVPTGRSTVADCADKNPSCATWAANGECKNSGTSAACAHSCLLALARRLSPVHPSLVSGAAASWMADNCAKSCGVCTTAATLLSVPVTTAATVRPYRPMYTSARLRAALVGEH